MKSRPESKKVVDDNKMSIFLSAKTFFNESKVFDNYLGNFTIKTKVIKHVQFESNKIQKTN